MGNRESNIRKHVTQDGEMYVVDLIEDGVLLEERELPGKSIHYANDVAENWLLGIINIETNPIR